MPVMQQAMPELSIREADRLRAIAKRVPVTNASAQNNCGVMLARRGLSHEAAACFERALDVDARMSLASQNLQQMAARTSVDVERVQQLTDRLRQSPHDIDTALELGKWHARLGRPADAATVLGELLDRTPDDLIALREMALVEQALGYPDRASAWLDRALGLEPENVAMHALAGEILYRRGKTEAAVAHACVQIGAPAGTALCRALWSRPRRRRSRWPGYGLIVPRRDGRADQRARRG